MSEPKTSNQLPEREVTKSDYVPSPDGPVRELLAAYRPDEKVSIKVTRNGTQFREDFIVDSKVLKGGAWSYKLKDKDGKLHDGGTLIAEKDIKRER